MRVLFNKAFKTARLINRIFKRAFQISPATNHIAVDMPQNMPI